MHEDRYHISRKEIDAMAGIEETHFQNPAVTRTRLSLGDKTGLTGFGFHIVTVPPGAETTAPHRHHFEDECVYILEGDGASIIGGVSSPISTGDFIGYRKGGAAHFIRNTGARPLRLIVVGERRAHDVIDYPESGKRLYINEGMAEAVFDMSAANASDDTEG